MKTWTGIPASAGIAIGPAFVFRKQSLEIDRTPIAASAVADEQVRLRAALDQACSELSTVRAEAEARAGTSTAAIFDAQRLMLQDPDLLAAIRSKLETEHLPSAAAVKDAAETFAVQLESLSDPYLAARAADVRDATDRVIRILLGSSGESLANLPQPVILVAEDLTPSDTVTLDRANVLGFIAARGGLTSHTAILARAGGLPAVLGVGDAVVEEIHAGEVLIVDGDEGKVFGEPEEATVQAWRNRAAQQRAAAATVLTRACEPATTRDGRTIEVVANIGGPADAYSALSYGAEGVGLLRTEFLFLDRASAPTEQEQYEQYFEIAEIMGQRPVVIRTLDAGGDKPPSYLDIGQELNPFLGWRAVRISLQMPDFFKHQLRAILRATTGHNLKIMFPMIASVEEVRAARRLLEEAQEELRAAGHAFSEHVEVGIMVEIPSAAVAADLFAPEVDFFSLGTNDLTQYTLAVDRTNARVAPLFDSLHPGVLRLIQMVVTAGHRAGRWVGMCGEMAGDLEAIPLLVGLGIDELSMNPRAIPAAKALIRELDACEMEALVARALQTQTSAEVHALRGG